MNKLEQLWNDIKTSDPEKNELFTISETVSSIISNIVIERNKKGISQRDLAKLTGLKQSAIARLESLQAIPRMDTLAKICYHLDLNLKIASNAETPEYVTIYKFVPTYIDNFYDSTSTQYTDSYIQESNDKGYSTCIS